MSYRHARLLAFVIGGLGIFAELVLLAALNGETTPAESAGQPRAGTRVEMPAPESGATILLEAMEVSL